jgi:hypothetical protein
MQTQCQQKSGTEDPLCSRETILKMTLDMVAGPQEEKCGLKYVIHISGGPVWTSVEHTYTEQWNYAGMISICGVFLNIRN